LKLLIAVDDPAHAQRAIEASAQLPARTVDLDVERVK
jgi:hypothetical protein